MSADEHVRAALEQTILRERVKLRAFFAAPVAAALGRYFAETVERGIPSDEARRKLADLLAPHGLADPDGTGRSVALTLAGASNSAVVRLAREVEEEYRRADLRGLGVGLDVFRAEFARRNRESPRPITAREVSAAMIQARLMEGVPAALSARLRLSRGWRRLTRTRFRQRRS